MRDGGKTAVKRLFTLLFLVLTASLQSGGLMPRPFGFGAALLPPAVVCLSLFDSGPAAVCFGLFAGAEWDFFSALPDGVLTLFLGVAAFVCSFSVRFFMRRKLSAALCLGAVFQFAAALLLSVFPASGFTDWRMSFTFYYLPSAVLSLLFVPICFLIFRAVYADPSLGRIPRNSTIR